MTALLEKQPYKSTQSGKVPSPNQNKNIHNLDFIGSWTSYFKTESNMTSRLEFENTTTYKFLEPNILK